MLSFMCNIKMGTRNCSPRRCLYSLVLGFALLAVVIVLLELTRNSLVVEIHWKQHHTEENRNEINAYRRTLLLSEESSYNHTLSPISLSYNCSDDICYEQLSDTEKEYFHKCKVSTESIQKRTKFGPIQNGTCHFQHGIQRTPIGLGSFPGSGNTWLRGLLEKITGICTGALYCDGALRTKGFTGEGIRGSSVIAIKSHNINPLFSNGILPKKIFNDMPVFGEAILLVRNPRDALIAEWNREKTKRLTNKTVSNHFLSIGKEYFGNNTDWNNYLQVKSERWKLHTSRWLINGKNNPVHVVRYEDLKADSAKELQKILNFLGAFTLSLEDIAHRLDNGYTNFYRVHQKDNFEHFTPTQEAMMKQLVNDTITILQEHALDTVFPIHNYLE